MHRSSIGVALSAAIAVGATVSAGACSSDDTGVAKAAVSGGGTAGAAGSGSGGTSGSSSGGGSSGAGSGGTGGSDASTDGSGSTGGTSGASGSGSTGGSSGTTGSGGNAPVSVYCGDGIRDPVTEECDDATGATPPDSCSSDCQVQDVLVDPHALEDAAVQPKVSRVLGVGRHPVGAGDSGFAVGFATTLPAPVTVSVKTFDVNGVPATDTFDVAADTSITENANPVVAAVSAGKFAVSYADLNADGEGLGVALRIVDPSGPSVGPLIRVNTTKTLGQHDPDMIWTGSELAIAWVDDSKLPMSGTDVKLRRFDASGSAITGEQTLAGSPDFEGDVALAPFGTSWAAAWRVATTSGESIAVSAGTSSWTVAVTQPGPANDKPALAELDSTHLLVVFTDGGGGTSTPRLSGAVLDTAATGAATPFTIDPLTEPYASDSSLDQTHPNAIRAGTRVYVAWRSALVPGDASAEELWLKEVSWSTIDGGFTLDLSAEEIELPRWSAHRSDDQRRPALAASPLGPQGAIASAWDDYGRVFGATEAAPDVVAELIPVPVVRLTIGDGGQ